MGNCSDESMLGQPRTNNSIEGYHNSLKRSFLYQYYSFVNLLVQIRDNESDTRILLERILCNDMPERKRCYIEKEERLVNFLYNHRDNNFGLRFVFELRNLL